jgi:Arc/MetJ family transcription regulator
MPTNLALDDALIDEARRIGNHKTKKEAVTAALDEYITSAPDVPTMCWFG